MFYKIGSFEHNGRSYCGWQYLAIPRTGSKSIQFFLRKNIPGVVKAGYHRVSPPPGDWSKYFVWTVVRNPYSRMVSAWTEYNGKKGNTQLSLIDYLTVHRNGAGKKNQFLRTQRDFVKKIPKGTPVTLLKFEDLPECLTELPFIDSAPELIHAHHGRKKYGTVEEHLNDDVISVINDVYAVDFSVFGYEMINV